MVTTGAVGDERNDIVTWLDIGKKWRYMPKVFIKESPSELCIVKGLNLMQS
jgi:hypothetical protein